VRIENFLQHGESKDFLLFLTLKESWLNSFHLYLKSLKIHSFKWSFSEIQTKINLLIGTNPAHHVIRKKRLYSWKLEYLVKKYFSTSFIYFKFQSIRILNIYLSICVYIFYIIIIVNNQPTFRKMYISIHVSIYLSIYLLIYLSIYLSIHEISPVLVSTCAWELPEFTCPSFSTL